MDEWLWNPVNLEGERAYLVALSQVTHIGPVRLKRLRDEFGTLDLAWRADERELLAVLDERTGRGIINARSRTDPPASWSEIAARGAEVVTVLDDDYPYSAKGDTGTAPGALSIGERCRRRMSQPWPSSELVVPLRMAVKRPHRLQGIWRMQESRSCPDSQRESMDSHIERQSNAGGRTVAVLASGVDIIYPQEHRQLARARSSTLARLISDYLARNQTGRSQLSRAKSHYFRTFAGDDRGRSAGEKRSVDHGRLRCRSGTRCLCRTREHLVGCKRRIEHDFCGWRDASDQRGRSPGRSGDCLCDPRRSRRRRLRSR